MKFLVSYYLENGSTISSDKKETRREMRKEMMSEILHIF